MKTITLQLKKLGKRKIISIPLQITKEEYNLKTLLETLVTNEVNTFNLKKTQSKVLPFLDNGQIQNMAEEGKIDFGDSKNLKTIPIEKAIEIAIQAFKDGLFTFFINDEEIQSLEQTLDLEEGVQITIIRLTFLTGLYY